MTQKKLFFCLLAGITISGSLFSAQSTPATAAKPVNNSIMNNIDGPKVQSTADGTKVVTNQDGSSVRIFSDGTLEVINSDGTVIQKNPDGSESTSN
jgi:hypothetical protein